jgi:hypothetical protein
MSSAACFNSAKAARAVMQRLSIALVSKSAWGGSNGNALNGSLARHADRRLEDFLVEAMRETYVEPFDRSNERVENFCFLRHDKEPCQLVRQITSPPSAVFVIRVEVQSALDQNAPRRL